MFRRRSKLRIDVGGVKIEIEGDPSFVDQTWERVRRDVVQKINDLVRRTRTVSKRPKVRSGSGREYVWIYGCTDYYNKVYAIETNRLRGTVLGKYLDVSTIDRIYVDRKEPLGRRILDMLTGEGDEKTLWSELTEKGRAYFRSETSDDDDEQDDEEEDKEFGSLS